MATIDRTFRVIVLGGIALAAVPAGACGGVVDATEDGGAGAFPDEGAADTGARDAFPSESGARIDDAAYFPDEGVPADAALYDAFPQEGPVSLDAGAPDSDLDAPPSDAPPSDASDAADDTTEPNDP